MNLKTILLLAKFGPLVAQIPDLLKSKTGAIRFSESGQKKILLVLPDGDNAALAKALQDQLDQGVIGPF